MNRTSRAPSAPPAATTTQSPISRLPKTVVLWRLLELNKHRLFYTLQRLRLPLATRIDDPEHGLAFDFLAESPSPTGPKVLTGHDNGLITIALEEADDAERERRRTEMGEPYRSLLGHFRHEVGHYFWDVLVRDGGRLDECRAVFGDDRMDYGEALQAHYQNGAPADWQEHYVSAYATTHPWEDWAETWAHYLHIVDTLEMASAFGIRVQPRVVRDEALSTEIDLDPYRSASMQEIIECLVAAHLCDEQSQSGDGQSGPLPVRAVAACNRQVEFRPRRRPFTARSIVGPTSLDELIGRSQAVVATPIDRTRT